MKKPKIKYPCNWGYRIVGECRKQLEEIVAQVISDRNFRITSAKKSRTGKYISLEVKTEVSGESDRNKIFSGLRQHPDVKIVL